VPDGQRTLAPLKSEGFEHRKKVRLAIRAAHSSMRPLCAFGTSVVLLCSLPAILGQRHRRAAGPTAKENRPRLSVQSIFDAPSANVDSHSLLESKVAKEAAKRAGEGPILSDSLIPYLRTDDGFPADSADEWDSTYDYDGKGKGMSKGMSKGGGIGKGKGKGKGMGKGVGEGKGKVKGKHRKRMKKDYDDDGRGKGAAWYHRRHKGKLGNKGTASPQPSPPPISMPTRIVAPPVPAPTADETPTMFPSANIESGEPQTELPSSIAGSYVPSTIPPGTDVPDEETVVPDETEPPTPSNIVRVGRFTIDYALDSSTAVNDANLVGATDATLRYLEMYLSAQFELNAEATLMKMASMVVATDTTLPQATFDVELVFDPTTSPIPTKDDVDVLIFSAFNEPAVQGFLAQLKQLPGPFSSTTGVTYNPVA
jgi:hypothetical protein